MERGKTQFLWERGYDLDKVAQHLEYYGFVGAELYTDDLLELILAPFRDYTKQEEMSEKNIDESLELLAKKIGVDINILRRLFYSTEFERFKMKVVKAEEPKEETMKGIEETKKEPPEKIQPTPEAPIQEEGQEEGKEEEIELDVEEESAEEEDEWEKEEEW